MAELEPQLTKTQRELLDLLWETKVMGKAGRRTVDPVGNYQFEYVKRLMRPVDFAEEGEFVLKLHEKNPDAPLSPYFINLREMPDPLLTKVAEAIAETFSGVNFPVCTGIPSAGTPIAKRFSEITGTPYIEIFDKAESGSTRKIIAAPNAPRGIGRWSWLLAIDDLITGADTKFEAAEVAKELHYRPTFGVLSDRQQGGLEQLQDAGLPVHASLTVSKIFGYYYRTERIDRARYEGSMNYLNTDRLRSGLPRLTLAT